MTKRALLSVALKVIGILALAYGIISAPNLIIYITSALNSSYSYSGMINPIALTVSEILSVLLIFVIAFILIVKGDNFARRLIPDEEEIQLSDIVRRESILFSAGIRIAGVVFAVMAIPQLFSKFALSFAREYKSNYWETYTPVDRIKQVMNDMWVANWANIVSLVIILILAAYLIWGAKHFAGLVYRDSEDELESIVYEINNVE